MKSYLRINVRKMFVLTCVMGLALGVLAWRAHADSWDHKTILTVNQPVQVTDRVLLEPGQYVFKLLDSQSDRHIVQIFNADQTHIINTVLAIPAYRPEPRGHTVFTFWETPAGYAKALRTWYYPGETYGEEFRYPKQLAMLETAAPVPAPAAEPAPEAAPPPEAPAPEPQPQSMNQEQPQPEQPAEIAQATPPPPAGAPAPEPEPQAPPQNLPKTATPYPAIGLAGLVLLGLYGLLRLRSFA
jgi:hypothetical protein